MHFFCPEAQFLCMTQRHHCRNDFTDITVEMTHKSGQRRSSSHAKHPTVNAHYPQ